MRKFCLYVFADVRESSWNNSRHVSIQNFLSRKLLLLNVPETEHTIFFIYCKFFTVYGKCEQYTVEAEHLLQTVKKAYITCTNVQYIPELLYYYCKKLCPAQTRMQMLQQCQDPNQHCKSLLSDHAMQAMCQCACSARVVVRTLYRQ
jgi:hypothetical protein